mgnify:CR=1 FL=1
MTTINPEAEYEIHISEKTTPDYAISTLISEWLHDNLTSLTDDEDNPVFNKVNYGFSEENLKSYGVKPICDVYIDNVEYLNEFSISEINKVHSIIIAYTKGTNDKAYMRICSVHDYIVQEFSTNPELRSLPDTVLNTYVDSSRIMIQPIRKIWGCMCAVELTHHI